MSEQVEISAFEALRAHATLNAIAGRPYEIQRVRFTALMLASLDPKDNEEVPALTPGQCQYLLGFTDGLQKGSEINRPKRGFFGRFR